MVTTDHIKTVLSLAYGHQKDILHVLLQNLNRGYTHFTVRRYDWEDRNKADVVFKTKLLVINKHFMSVMMRSRYLNN